MNRILRCVLTLCCTASFAILASCGSSPSVDYYALSGIDQTSTEYSSNAPLLVAGPMQLPEYLNRSQMVSRGSGTEVQVDDYNRWAEPLTDSLHRVLAGNVDELLESVVVVEYPSILKVDYRLLGRIDRYDVDEAGLVVLQVQWGVADMIGVPRVAPQRAQYTAQASSPNDAGSVADAMSDALEKFSRDVATQIDAANLQPKD